MLQVGKVLAGRYELRKHLADGGMGEIWLAHHLALDLPVAVKLMSVAGDARSDLKVRFEREARAIAQLKSPHVVQVFDYGSEDERPFFVMELLEGQDLLEVLQVRPSWPLSTVATLTQQVAKGLTSAHALGIIHRDIKPGNLFIARNAGETLVKIVDFGIAKFSDAARQITVTNTVLGSPYYMSPEQLKSETLDHRVDLWGLAVVVFRLCTGNLPFDGETAVEITESVLCNLRTPINEQVPHAARLRAFFDRAFAERREDRFASASELSEAFQAIAGSQTALDALLEPLPDDTTVKAKVPTRDELEAALAVRPGGDDATWTPEASVETARVPAEEDEAPTVFQRRDAKIEATIVMRASRSEMPQVPSATPVFAGAASGSSVVPPAAPSAPSRPPSSPGWRVAPVAVPTPPPALPARAPSAAPRSQRAPIPFADEGSTIALRRRSLLREPLLWLALVALLSFIAFVLLARSRL